MVVHLEVAQGSTEWLRARSGKPTASQFHRIITPAKGELSKSARKFMFRLLAERLLNEISESLEGQEWVERGKELEGQAIKHLEFEREIITKPCGLLLTDDWRIGASPDRLLVKEVAAVECKVPAPWTHLEWMFDGFGSDYIPQVQGQIFVGELEWCARYSYHPSMPSVFKPTYRDDKYQTALKSALMQFCDELDELEYRARKRGVFSERLKTLTPLEAAVEELQRPSARKIKTEPQDHASGPPDPVAEAAVTTAAASYEPGTKTVEEAYESIKLGGDIGLSVWQYKTMGISDETVECLMAIGRVERKLDEFNNHERFYAIPEQAAADNPDLETSNSHDDGRNFTEYGESFTESNTIEPAALDQAAEFIQAKEPEPQAAPPDPVAEIDAEMRWRAQNKGLEDMCWWWLGASRGKPAKIRREIKKRMPEYEQLARENQ